MMSLQEPTQLVNGWYYEMEGAAQACVECYCELADIKVSSLRKVGIPCMDDHLHPSEDFVVPGVLSSVCSQAVLKCLYMTRLARPELYWEVNPLAREVTRWTVACDRRVHRLICLIHVNKHSVIKSWIGTKASECKVMLFCDVSFAGDLGDSESTPGCVLCLVGTRTFRPITWICKNQGAISHSSAQAQIIALDTGLRLEGLPAMILWDLIIIVVEPLETNSTTNFQSPQTNARVTTQHLLPLQTKELLNVGYVHTDVAELSSVN